MALEDDAKSLIKWMYWSWVLGFTLLSLFQIMHDGEIDFIVSVVGAVLLMLLVSIIRLFTLV